MACRKFILVTVLLSFFACPVHVLSQETRGIKPITSDIQNRLLFGNYHALIIGINNYKEWNPLKTAVKDATALKEILIERYGFKKDRVVLRTDNDATRLGLLRDLRNLASNLGSQDNLLIYYAGHGQLDDLTEDGYWIPVEGKLKEPATWIPHSTIKNILSSERVKAKNIVVVADSCYSGTLLRGGPSLLSLTEEGYHDRLLKLAARRSRQVITSGGLEPVADKGRGGHSLFAYYFLKALKENNRPTIDLENLFHTYVWKPVTEIGDQRPNVGRLKTPMEEDGQFVLLTTMERHPSSVENTDTELESEKKRLAEEAAQIERERQELEELKVLLEQKKELEDERQRLEAEKLKLASIPKTVTTTKISLRKKPMMLSTETKIKEMLAKYNFFDKSMNISGTFENHFVDNKDGTVTDEATGLMWQKAGSSSSLENRGAKEYINKLNKERFAGHSDWRMPTVEELASLIKKPKINDVHIDPVFDNKQIRCWTVDQCDANRSYQLGAWLVHFQFGEISKAMWINPKTGGGMYLESTNISNYIKAVRSVKY